MKSMKILGLAHRRNVYNLYFFTFCQNFNQLINFKFNCNNNVLKTTHRCEILENTETVYARLVCAKCFNGKQYDCTLMLLDGSLMDWPETQSKLKTFFQFQLDSNNL